MGGCTVIGLMGGIGSGKTTVARMLADLGATVLDADAICAELHRTEAVKAGIESRWGAAALGPDGEPDRAKLADIVFGDPAHLAELNRLLHPRIAGRIERDVAACRRNGTGLCVIDAPLLLETGLDRLCDATVFVECDPDTRGRRVADHRGWSPDQIQRREEHQHPLDRKRQRADYVVVNSGDLETTRRQVERIAAGLTQTGE